MILEIGDDCIMGYQEIQSYGINDKTTSFLWVIKQNRIKWGQVFIHRMCELIFSPFRIYWEKVCVIAKSAILSVIFFLFDLILGNFLSLYIAE